MPSRFAFSSSIAMPGDILFPKRHSSWHFESSTNPIKMARFLSVLSPSSINCGNSRWGASGIAPFVTANRQQRLARSRLCSTSPASGEQMNTSGRNAAFFASALDGQQRFISRQIKVSFGVVFAYSHALTLLCYFF
jgi:hypothetical protein